MKNFRFLILYLIIGLFTFGCGGSPEISSDQLAINKGSSEKIQTENSGENNQWVSSNEKVVTVDGEGNVTGENVGNAWVQLTSGQDGNVLDSLKITVKDPLPDEPYQAVDFTTPGLFLSGIEGPAFFDGHLYATDFDHESTIGQVDLEGNCKLFVELPEGSRGNGIRFNADGMMMVADYTGHNILKINPENKNVEVFAHAGNMNQPNDVAIAKNGYIFASDPNWGEDTGQLWRIDPDGTTHLLEKNMGTTNGVEVSADESTLYVNESVQRKVWAYDLASDGSLSNKRLLISFDEHGMDGMRCDKQGNLYITRHGKGTVAMVSPEGELIREIDLTGEQPTNIAFGGEDGKTCFVTLMDRGSIEIFRSEYVGRSWNLFE